MNAVYFDLAGPAGRLEALLDVPPDEVRGVVVLAPPHPDHGGTLRSRVVHEAARGFKQIGCVVLRFNYRGVGLSAGTFTGGPGERDDFHAALEAARRIHPGVPSWAAGYSFGAWVAMTAGASDPAVSVLVGIAPPVRDYDFGTVIASVKPRFIIHPERDELAPLDAIRRFYAGMNEPRELVVIDGADHAFDGCASEVGDAIVDLFVDYDVAHAEVRG